MSFTSYTVIVFTTGRAARVNRILQAGAAEVKLRLAAGIAAGVSGITVGRVVEVDCSAIGRAATVESDMLQAKQQKSVRVVVRY